MIVINSDLIACISKTYVAIFFFQTTMSQAEILPRVTAVKIASFQVLIDNPVAVVASYRYISGWFFRHLYFAKKEKSDSNWQIG